MSPEAPATAGVVPSRPRPLRGSAALWLASLWVCALPAVGFADGRGQATPGPVVEGAQALQTELAQEERDGRCWSRLVRDPVVTNRPLEDALAAEVQDYQELVEKALTYRAETIKAVQGFQAKAASGEALSGADLRLLNEGTLAHLLLRDELWGIAERYECLLEAPPNTLQLTGIGPATRFKAVALSLAAALTLYDNYLLAISLLQEDAKLRRLVDDKDPGYGIERGRMFEVTRSYNSAVNRSRVRRGIRFYVQARLELGEGLGGDEQLEYLQLLIEQSPSYQTTRRPSPLRILADNLNFLGVITEDILDALGREGMNLFSMAFGNSLGVIEARRGKLHGREDVRVTLEGILRPGDILLEKTPFRLTDKFIPGHWGHVAVWVGGEADLRRLGIWDHPVVAPHRGRLRAGNGVVEALRSGVELNTIGHFLNVDDLAVLRAPDLGPEEAAEVVVMALRQVGKAYDFNFDVETSDRIVCSELVYATYTGMDWPTEKTLGRATISPDHVASKALQERALDVVLLYHDGEPVAERPLEFMAALLATGADPHPPGLFRHPEDRRP